MSKNTKTGIIFLAIGLILGLLFANFYLTEKAESETMYDSSVNDSVINAKKQLIEKLQLHKDSLECELDTAYVRIKELDSINKNRSIYYEKRFHFINSLNAAGIRSYFANELRIPKDN